MPNLVYSPFQWSDVGSRRFADAGQRTRFVMTSGMLNPPPDDTPAYCIQFVSDKDYPRYNTPNESLLVFVNSDALYLLTSAQALAVIGYWAHRRNRARPAGPDSEERLDRAQMLWTGKPAKGSTCAVGDAKLHAAMEQFRLGGLNELYDAVVSRCSNDEVPVSMTWGQLRRALPRDSSAHERTDLGQSTTRPADRRVFRQRSHGKKAACTSAAVEGEASP